MLDEGTGEPIVVVAGALSTAANWDKVAARLRTHAPPVAEPARVRKLVLYEPPVPLGVPNGGEVATRMRKLIDDGKDGAALAVFMREVVRAQLWMRAVTRVAFRVAHIDRLAAAQLADMEAIDATVTSAARYAALAMPTLLLRGRSSPAHLRERVAELAKVIRVSRIEELSTGHNAEALRPAELARAIADFATEP
jgi:pimeloyl-ACP methyl ester carboxylesterase